MTFESLIPFGEITDDVLKIQNSFTFAWNAKSTPSCPVIAVTAAYKGSDAPKIRLCLTAAGQSAPLYESHDYRIGKPDTFTRNMWRLPPVFMENMTLSMHVQIPDGTSLLIRECSVSQDSGAPYRTFGPRFNAHLGFWGMAPDNTMPAFELAAASGFPACIVVPKVTKDGVLVCIHDDSINRTARDKDGNPPTDVTLVCDLTYEELQQWEYGSYKNEVYKGTKIPLLSEFFDLCAKTGMRPMFSTHPDLPTEKWIEVKKMLKSRGLLSVFHVKSFGLEVLQHAHSVLGSEIDGYTLDVGTGKWSEDLIENIRNSGIDRENCRIGIEVRSTNHSQQIAKTITDAGFFAAVWDLKRRDFDDYTRFMSWGITEFTEDYHCSMGLNY